MELIFDGSTLSREEWAQYYPPHVAECKQLPGTGIPRWLYTFNLCTSCQTPLQLCKHNPFNVSSTERPKVRVQVRQEVAEVPSTVDGAPAVIDLDDDVVIEEPTERRRRGSVSRVITPEQETIILARFDAGDGCTVIAYELNVHQPIVSQYLKDNGRVVVRGKKRVPLEVAA